MKAILLMLMMIFISSCTEKINYVEITPNPIPEAERDYNSHFYYSYVSKKIIDNDELMINEFNPGAVKLLGDTLIFSDNTSGQQSIYFYSIKQNKILRRIREWSHNESIDSFPESRIEDIEISDEKLYVSNLNSQIDVFNLRTGEFITRIGTGSWGDGDYQILHSFALVAKDKRLYVRTKNRIHTYLESDVVKDNYKKIKWECRTSSSGFSVNNPFNSYQMVDAGEKIWITEMTGMNKLICINPELVEAGFEKVIIDDNESINLNFSPSGIALHTSERIFIAENDGKIHIYDFKKKSIIHSFNKVYGDIFSAYKLDYNNNVLVISDRKNNKISVIDVIKHEIKEFE